MTIVCHLVILLRLVILSFRRQPIVILVLVLIIDVVTRLIRVC